jgi:hypothetical protein
MTPLTENHFNAILHQIGVGVRVRIACLKDCQEVVSDDRELDFGLFDAFAVSFWRFAPDRLFKISTAPAECQRRVKMYDRIADLCVQVPGKTDGDLSLFDSKEELRVWSETLSRVSVAN